MEELLVPWIHYIPVESNFSDLEVQVQWCLDNLEKCELIGAMGACFMEPFLDSNNEDKILSELLKDAEILNSKFQACERRI